MSYEQRLAKWIRYIRQVATRSRRGWVFTSQEDLEQELSLTLWRCHVKYPHLDDEKFYRAFSKSVQCRLASLFRPQKRRHQLQEVSIETARNSRNPNGLVNSGQKQTFVSESAESGEVGLEFYRTRIKEIVDGISPDGLVCVLKRMDQKPAPRRDLVERHADALRERKAMNEVMELARGR